MGIQHKFKECNFGKGFQTQNGILTVTPYKPKILFIGTFNPLTDDVANPADFFYGRNWFWPVLFNIFVYKQQVVIEKQRKFYPPHFNPTLDNVFKFMKTHQITFADLIVEVLPDEDINCVAGNKVIYNQVCYDLIKDSDLAKLDVIGEVDWSAEHLKDYLRENPSITQVYFTRKSAKPFSKKLEEIQDVLSERNSTIKYLFTPSGQGLKGTPRNSTLMEQWIQSTLVGYNNLDENWVNPK